jgi:hypothetical protein
MQRHIDRALKAAASLEGLTKEEKLERMLLRELDSFLRSHTPAP